MQTPEQNRALICWTDSLMIYLACMSLWFTLPVFFGTASQGWVYMIFLFAWLAGSIVFAARFPRGSLGEHVLLMRFVVWLLLLHSIGVVTIISGALLAFLLLIVTGQYGKI